MRQTETSVAVTRQEIEVSLRRSLSKDRESDKGGGIPRKSIADEFEEELEKLMERFVMEKLEKTSRIQSHYNHQINELKGMGSMETIQEVIKEMQKNMDRELQDLAVEIDTKRKQEIAILKRKMLGVN
jgi:demethoxyubiquinone hydroxylase (CLK1/Coq7/Cat5 family)